MQKPSRRFRDNSMSARSRDAAEDTRRKTLGKHCDCGKPAMQVLELSPHWRYFCFACYEAYRKEAQP